MAGGRASSLMAQLELAERYVSSSAAVRRAQPGSTWEAYLRVLGGDLDAPDWPVGGAGAGERERALALKQLADCLAGLVIGVGGCALRCLRGWEHKAAGV